MLAFIDGGSISFADRDRARGFESYSKNLIPQPILRVSLLVCDTRSYARKDKHKPLVSNPFVAWRLKRG